MRAAPGGVSSTMPHKRNPVDAVLARACARRAHALASGFAGEHEHERAAGAWHAEWEPLGDAPRDERRCGRGGAGGARGPRGRRRTDARQRAAGDHLGSGRVRSSPSTTSAPRAPSSTGRSPPTARSSPDAPSRRRGERRAARPRELAGNDAPHVGPERGRSRRPLPRRALRPSGARRVAGRAGDDRRAGPARRSGSPTSSGSSALPSAGSRSAAWSACGSRAHTDRVVAARPRLHRAVPPAAGAMARARSDGARAGRRGDRRRGHRPLVHSSSSATRRPGARSSPRPRPRATPAAARRSGGWTCARTSRESRFRPR